MLDPEAPDLPAIEVVAPGKADREMEDARSAHDRVIDVEECRGRAGNVALDGIASGVSGSLTCPAIGRQDVRGV